MRAHAPILVALALASALPAAADPGPADSRRAGYVVLSLGAYAAWTRGDGGWSSASRLVAGQLGGDSGDHLLLQGEAGVTLAESWLLGGQITSFRVAAAGRYPGADQPAAARFGSLDLVLTWFPAQRGPFLRAGYGLAIRTFTWHPDSVEFGLDALAGAGWELGNGPLRLRLGADVGVQGAVRELASLFRVSGYVGVGWL